MPITPINTLLIANRGEIASRIIRTCKKMGIKSVAVFSDADRDAPYVKAADTAVHIGESNPAASYLDGDKIIAVAKAHGADAIHPGYGFLSENAGFAIKCRAAGLIFIGPNPKAIEEMGSKSRAKTLMKKQGVPVIPGYQGKDQSLKALMAAAKDIGFPVLLKATAGGGGKGMRIVRKAADLEKSIAAAQREAGSAFGDEELIIEKYIDKGRHIEFQIMGDQHGNILHVLERECTIQRRYQKVLEESPSPVLNDALRNTMGEAAVKAAKALDYDNAGTVEFIFDDESRNFYFLEVNTRLQVEHPVTEAITGLDLVQMQIEVAEGRPLSLTQKDIKANGYALEARLYAEDASNDFRPAAGKIHLWKVPEVDGLRVDTAVETGFEISIHYDPMIAKLIVHGSSRATAHRKMAYALRHLVCLGLTTNQDFLLHVLENSEFQKGDYDTHFIENKISLDELGTKTESQKQLAAICVTLWDWYHRNNRRNLLRHMPSGWRNSPYQPQMQAYVLGEEELLAQYYCRKEGFEFFFGEKRQEVQLLEVEEHVVNVILGGVRYRLQVFQSGNEYFIHSPETANLTLKKKERFPRKEVEKVKGGFEAPMPSQVVKILVKKGQAVKSGEGLIVLSSMKMENTIEADADGVVEEIFAVEGQGVEAGFLLLRVM